MTKANGKVSLISYTMCYQFVKNYKYSAGPLLPQSLGAPGHFFTFEANMFSMLCQ